MTANGLMISAQAILHAAEYDDTPEAAPKNLPFSSAANMGGWASWVRASLYLSDFLKALSWSATGDEKSGQSVTFTYGEKPFVTLHRPKVEMFQSQTRYLRNYMDQRADRSAEILTQLGYPIDYFAMIMGLNAARNGNLFELIAITQVITSHVAMVAKHHLACRRPDRLGATVMPMLPTPGHGTFPSAHAAEAVAVAVLLAGILDAPEVAGHYPAPVKLKKLLFKQAERIAVNRTVAGVHYPIDSWAGAALGEAVAQIILAKCRGGGVVIRDYTATDIDFSIARFLPELWMPKGATVAPDPDTGLVRGAATELPPPDKEDVFLWLWQRAVSEFQLA